MLRCIAIAGVCLLAACSTQGVRCDRHLTPINVLQPLANSSAPAYGGADAAAKGGTVSDEPQASKGSQRAIGVSSGPEAEKHRRSMPSPGQGERP